MDFFSLFQFDFIRRSFEAGVLLSIVAPILGMFLVVRRYSLFADALAHVSLLGVALAIFFKIPVFFGALATSLLAAVGIERLRASGRVFGEAVIALFLSSSLALSVVILSATKGLNTNLFGYLFGSLTTVGESDVYVFAVLGAVMILFLLFFYRELFLYALDEDLARVSGVRVKMLNGVFIMLTAVMVTAAIQMVGVLLIGALMVVPVLAAMQFDLGFRKTLLLSVLFSLCSVLVGFFAAYWLDLASGGAIVIVAVILFFLAYFSNRLAGKLVGRRRQSVI